MYVPYEIRQLPRKPCELENPDGSFCGVTNYDRPHIGSNAHDPHTYGKVFCCDTHLTTHSWRKKFSYFTPVPSPEKIPKRQRNQHSKEDT